MSVNTTVAIVTDGRNYNKEVRQTPDGVQPFNTNGSVTGSTGGGHSTVNFQFNPGLDRTFQPYVVIDFISIEHQIADGGNAWVYQVVNEWERSAGIQRTVELLVPLVSESSVQFAIASHRTINLGRVELGTAGLVRVRMEEINTAVTNVAIAGYLADYPLIGNDTWRA